MSLLVCFIGSTYCLRQKRLYLKVWIKYAKGPFIKKAPENDITWIKAPYNL